MASAAAAVVRVAQAESAFPQQAPLFCRCGAAAPARSGLCSRCRRCERHSRERFAGRRERVLRRDRRTCQGCGALPARPHVHHRRPRLNHARWLVTLCPACHARVHHTRVLRRLLPERLIPLWRELHPSAPEQLRLALG